MESIIAKFPEFFKRQDDAEKKLPVALSIQKKKFLIAINKSTAESFSQEDEDLVKNVSNELSLRQNIRILKHGYISCQWDDSKASERVHEILQKHAIFQLSKYLDCVEIVFFDYSDSSGRISYYDAIEYVLTHARQFGDPTKTIFKTDRQCSSDGEMDAAATLRPSPPLPDSQYINSVSRLIEELRRAYDETNYKALNVNVTYFTLLMLRRIVKNKAEFSAAFKKIQIHDSYVKLCPSPLSNQLPRHMKTDNLYEVHMQGCAHLAVEAYLNTEDERTKRVLRVTCVQYMEWNGLQLPNLFFKVAKLYEIEAGDLWDLLISRQTSIALINLAKDYYNQYESVKADPSKSHRWFPYCRVLNTDYHRDLSMVADNSRICIILAYLVDLKIGFDKSTVRLSHWVKSSPFRGALAETANVLYEKMKVIPKAK